MPDATVFPHPEAKCAGVEYRNPRFPLDAPSGFLQHLVPVFARSIWLSFFCLPVTVYPGFMLFSSFRVYLQINRYKIFLLRYAMLLQQGGPTMKIKILLAYEQKKMREGLRSLLEKYAEFHVAAEADNGESTIALAAEFNPDVVVMDTAMPGLDGIEATRRIIAEAPRAKVIALTMNLERRDAVEMLKAGTSGYLLKKSAFDELVDAIREVVAGNTYLSPPVISMVIGEYVHKELSEETSLFAILTPREREVLKLVAEGRSTLQIAADIDISAKTVDTHRQHIMDKLNIRGIADLTRYAIREGISVL
jgi:DNA-binding NarL/FixJ family response regulator